MVADRQRKRPAQTWAGHLPSSYELRRCGWEAPAGIEPANIRCRSGNRHRVESRRSLPRCRARSPFL